MGAAQTFATAVSDHVCARFEVHIGHGGAFGSGVDRDGASSALNSEMLQRLYGAECDELLGAAGERVVDEEISSTRPREALAVA